MNEAIRDSLAFKFLPWITIKCILKIYALTLEYFLLQLIIPAISISAWIFVLATEKFAHTQCYNYSL